MRKWTSSFFSLHFYTLLCCEAVWLVLCVSTLCLSTGIMRWHLTSCGRVMTAPCCVREEILWVKYSLQEASTERWALKLWPSTTTVISHNVSRRRCSSSQCSTWEECTVDSNVNTDDRGADMAIRDTYMSKHTHTHTLIVFPFKRYLKSHTLKWQNNNKNMPTSQTWLSKFLRVWNKVPAVEPTWLFLNGMLSNRATSPRKPYLNSAPN